MANIKKKLSSNIEGNFFVDSTCINCDACRQLAPETFQEHEEYSSVYRQPAGDLDCHHAYQAMIACPVGSIGVMQPDRDHWQAAMASFPLQLDDSLYYAGFNCEKSFGANSYVLQDAGGNWLIDSPRYIKHLVDAFERIGGIRYVFLTHEDDVADAARYAKRFGATRIIHRADLAAVPDAEWIVDGHERLSCPIRFKSSRCRVIRRGAWRSCMTIDTYLPATMSGGIESARGSMSHRYTCRINKNCCGLQKNSWMCHSNGYFQGMAIECRCPVNGCVMKRSGWCEEFRVPEPVIRS